MQETLCRACASALLVDLSPAERSNRRVFSVRTHVRLERDGPEDYLRCPNCSAKNIAFLRTDSCGNRTVELVTVVMDDM